MDTNNMWFEEGFDEDSQNVIATSRRGLPARPVPDRTTPHRHLGTSQLASA